MIDIDPRAVRRGLMPVVGAGPRTNDQIEEMIRKLCYFFVLNIYIGLKKKIILTKLFFFIFSLFFCYFIIFYIYTLKRAPM